MNKNLIIGAALIGGGAYYAYKKGLFGKGKTETPEEAIKQNQEVIDKLAIEKAKKVATAAVVVKTATAIKQATDITNPKSYAGKVAYIQGQLNVPTDGDAGAVTNKAFAAVYGLDRGNISTDNIDYYVARVKAKNTLSAIKAAAATINARKSAAVNISNDAKKFLELVNDGKYKATLTKDVKANAFVFDNLKKVFVDVNQPTTFPKGLTFGKGQFSTQPRGIYVLKKGANNKYFAISINDFIVTI